MPKQMNTIVRSALIATFAVLAAAQPASAKAPALFFDESDHAKKGCEIMLADARKTPLYNHDPTPRLPSYCS